MILARIFSPSSGQVSTIDLALDFEDVIKAQIAPECENPQPQFGGWSPFAA